MDQHTEELFEMLPLECKETVANQVKGLIVDQLRDCMQKVQPASSVKATPPAAFAAPPKVATKKKQKKPRAVKNGEAQVSTDEVRAKLPSLLEPGREYARREILALCDENGLHLAPHKMTNQVLAKLTKDGILTNNGEKTQKMKYRLV